MTFKEFWENGGRDLAMGLGFLILGSAISNTDKKVNRTIAACTEGFDAANKHFANFNSFKEQSYTNFKLIAKDINRLATTTGYKGKLGVNS